MSPRPHGMASADVTLLQLGKAGAVNFEVWFLVVGSVLIFMALAGTAVKRLPLSSSMLYLAVGYALGPGALGALNLDEVYDATLLERLTEIAVLISLFSAGLKLRVPVGDWRWVLPVRLATLSMVITVGLVALLGVYALGLPLGAAVLLGAVLAPTDPVLASDVQVSDPNDRDHLRFSLTGEAGMNDGTAFPFVMLGLGLLGLHELGGWGVRWFAVDLVWAVVAGTGVGALSGWAITRLVLYLRQHHREAVGFDDFLALGLIALSYGIALLIHGYGFLAVFAAGVAVRRVEMTDTPGALRSTSGESRELAASGAATDPDRAPAYMAHAILRFNEHIERVVEVMVVVILGSLLHWVEFDWQTAVFIGALLLVIRPLSVLAGIAGSSVPPMRVAMLGWFGIRGVGSLYYLTYAIGQGLEPADARTLVNYTLAAVTASIFVHGISVTPLMSLYTRYSRSR